MTIIKFADVPIKGIFTVAGERYVRIWDIAKSCCGGANKGFYNAVSKADMSKSFTFDKDDDVEVEYEV